MSCDTFLADLETGSFLERRRARKHAESCPQCAAALESLNAAREELAAAPALTPELRRLWELAAESNVVRPLERRRRVNLRILVAVNACAFLLYLAFGLQPEPEDAPIEQQITENRNVQEVESAARVVVIDPGRELAELADAVNELEAELKGIERLAERREAERQFAVLLKRVEVW
jgi:hypothetical protein